MFRISCIKWISPPLSLSNSFLNQFILLASAPPSTNKCHNSVICSSKPAAQQISFSVLVSHVTRNKQQLLPIHTLYIIYNSYRSISSFFSAAFFLELKSQHTSPALYRHCITSSTIFAALPVSYRERSKKKQTQRQVSWYKVIIQEKHNNVFQLVQCSLPNNF